MLAQPGKLCRDRNTPPWSVPTNRSVPLTARQVTAMVVRGMGARFSEVQLAPLSLDIQALPYAAAKRFVPETARAETPPPRPAALQLVPLFVERKTPPSQVPANRFAPETARDQIKGFVRPVLTAVQLVPLSVDKKTP